LRRARNDGFATHIRKGWRKHSTYFSKDAYNRPKSRQAPPSGASMVTPVYVSCENVAFGIRIVTYTQIERRSRIIST
jgi:hypothetical protein